jgi:hypothetical protein
MLLRAGAGSVFKNNSNSFKFKFVRFEIWDTKSSSEELYSVFILSCSFGAYFS